MEGQRVMMMKIIMMMMMMMMVTVNGQQACQTPENQPGKCVSIRSCPVLQSLFKTDVNQVLSYICDRAAARPQVCCPTTKPLVDPSTTLVIGVTPQPSQSSLLPTNCGSTLLLDRVVGGGDAGLTSWPWIALLRGSDARGSTWFCGGVLISDRYVLTAAHCVHSSSDYRLERVRLGEHELGVTPDCNTICAPEPQDIQASEVIIHEGFGTVENCRLCHDIALIRLATPAKLADNFVVPICLSQDPAKDFNVTNRDYTNRLGWVAGWGATHRVRDTFRPNVLQEVLLPITNQFCQQERRKYPDPRMMMCAGGEGRDSCRGDSGGPLVILNNLGKHYVIGVVSKGPRVCGASFTQGIYTNVDFYRPWILSKLRP